MGRCPYCGAGSDQPCGTTCDAGFEEASDTDTSPESCKVHTHPGFPLPTGPCIRCGKEPFS